MGLIVFASILQKNHKIPSPITLMTAVLISLAVGYPLFKIGNSEFDTLVLLTLPLLISADALKLKWVDLMVHGISLFWVAVVSVLVSIGFGVLINDYVLVDYPLPVAAVVMLFCMISATDPITVSAIFSNFKVPHKLKVITEGESLFNDATALVVFSIALIALNRPEDVSVSYIAIKTLSVVFGAVIVGLIVGWLTTMFLKLSDDEFVEATIILLSAYVSYYIAELFHCSGILAVIVDIVMANYVIQKVISKEDEEIARANASNNLNLFRYAMTTRENRVTIIKSIDFSALFASSLLFISIAAIANLDKLIFYGYEILAVFIASTIIRALMMLKFAIVSNSVNRMQIIQSHWWAVLTFAGSKGALSILMVHMIPNTFKYKELFENIIIGNIFLSTFIYAAILGVIIIKNAEKFDEECRNDSVH